MTTIPLDAPLAAPSVPDLESRDRWAFVVFSTWTIVGLFLDGWSHNHHKPETFFTPWHAVLYSGFGAGMVWTAIEGRRRRRLGLEVETPGGRLTELGLVLFAVGAIGDFGWHQLFGIERNLAALLSPTHLLLMTGGVLLVSAPLRTAYAATDTATAPTWEAFVPTLVSVVLTLALVSFFLMYLSPFRIQLWARALAPSSGLGQQFQSTVVASVLISGALFSGALLYLLRRWRPPFGTFTFLFGAVAFAVSGLDTFQLLPLAAAAPAGGLVADLLVLRLHPSPSAGEPWRIRLIAATAAGVLWLTYFAILELHYHLGWQVHLWAGAVFMAVFSALGLSVLAFPPRTPERLAS